MIFLGISLAQIIGTTIFISSVQSEKQLYFVFAIKYFLTTKNVNEWTQICSVGSSLLHVCPDKEYIDTIGNIQVFNISRLIFSFECQRTCVLSQSYV